MANTLAGNKLYLDSAGLAPTPAKSQPRVLYAVFTPSNDGDSVSLADSSASGSAACWYFQGATGKNSMYFRFDESPLLFNSGIYVNQISSGAILCLVISSSGSNS